MKRFVKLPPFEGVGAGASGASVSCQLGNTYHAIILSGTNVTPNELKNIRVVINAKTVMEFPSGSDIVRHMEGDGLPNCPTNMSADLSSTAKLVINFDSPTMRLRDLVEMTAIGTGLAGQRYAANSPAVLAKQAVAGELIDPNPVTSLQIFFDIDAGATGVTLRGTAVVSEPSPLGYIRSIRSHTLSINRGSVYEWANIPKNAPIRRIRLDSQYITKVDLQRNGFSVLDETEREDLAFWTSSRDRVIFPAAQTNGEEAGYLVAFDAEGFGGENLVTHPSQTNDLRIKIHSTGSGESTPVNLEIERVGTLLSL